MMLGVSARSQRVPGAVPGRASGKCRGSVGEASGKCIGRAGGGTGDCLVGFVGRFGDDKGNVRGSDGEASGECWGTIREVDRNNTRKN